MGTRLNQSAYTELIREDIEVMEREEDNRYRRLVSSKGVLVGAQAINWSENMGCLLSAILRREKITSAAYIGNWNRPFLQSARVPVFGRKEALV